MDISLFKTPRPHTKLDLPRDTGQMIIAGPKSFRRAERKVLSGKSKKNPFINFGGNRQNIEKKMRILYEADKGYKIINRDQYGADALIVAHLCKPGRYRELFENGVKPHLYLALQFFPDAWRPTFGDKVDEAIKTPIPNLQQLDFWKPLSKLIKSSDDWAPKKRFYYFGKKTGHSGNYGMAEDTLVDNILKETEGEIVLETSEARRWLNTYHCRLFPEIQRDFQFGVMMGAKRNGELRNLFNWPYKFTGKNVDKLSPKDLNELYSWIPQSTVACITLMAYVEMQEYIEDNDKDWHILQETHDSITMEAPEAEAEECAIKLGEFMQREMVSPVDGKHFRMKSECQIGYNWSPFDKDTNTLGLQEVSLN